MEIPKTCVQGWGSVWKSPKHVLGGGCEVQGCVQARSAAAPWQWQSGRKFLRISWGLAVSVILPVVFLLPCIVNAHAAGAVNISRLNLCVGKENFLSLHTVRAQAPSLQPSQIALEPSGVVDWQISQRYYIVPRASLGEDTEHACLRSCAGRQQLAHRLD